MNEVMGVFGELSVWGWPWHGVIEEVNAGPGLSDYYLRRADGTAFLLRNSAPPYVNVIPADTFNRLQNYRFSVPDRGGVTHQVRVPGHVMPARTPEQLARDYAQGAEWCDAAMVVGHEHLLYGKPLGVRQWVYSTAAGRWLMEVVYVTAPVSGSTPDADLSVEVRATPLGRLGEPALSPATVGSASAPSCLDGEWRTVLTNAIFPPVVIQSVRSDGGELYLEVQRQMPRPSLRTICGAGYYRLNVQFDGSSWTVSLALVKRASEVYSQSIDGNLSESRVGIEQEITEPAPGTEDPYIFTYKVVTTGASAKLFLTASGTINQESSNFLGYVYDRNDIAHTLQSRVRIVHTCSVSPPSPELDGEAKMYQHGSDPPTWDISNPRTVTINLTNSVTSTITAEVLFDGAVASSAEAVLHNQAAIHYRSFDESVGPSGPITRERASWSESGYLRIGTHQIDLNYNRAEADVASWPNIWPVHNGIYSWNSVGLDGELRPWYESNDSRAHRSLQVPMPSNGGIGGTPSVSRGSVLAGAVRMANNVYVPCITAGVPRASSGGASSSWWLETTVGSVDNGLSIPSSVLGQPVGPAGAGLGAISFGNSAVVILNPIEFDYLHNRLAAGGGII